MQSDHVQAISETLWAECGDFVVTCSVQEYSCSYLVCAGIFMWSLGLCRNILHNPVLLCGHIGLNKTKHRNR